VIAFETVALPLDELFVWKHSWTSSCCPWRWEKARDF